MGTDSFDQNHLILIAHLDLQPILVTLDIEYHPIVRKKACRRESSSYICRCSPRGSLGFRLPCCNLPPNVTMFVGEFIKNLKSDDLHNSMLSEECSQN